MYYCSKWSYRLVPVIILTSLLEGAKNKNNGEDALSRLSILTLYIHAESVTVCGMCCLIQHVPSLLTGNSEGLTIQCYT